MAIRTKTDITRLLYHNNAVEYSLRNANEMGFPRCNAEVEVLSAAQAEEKKAVDAQAEVAAFDRQNHAGASEALAGALREAIKEGAAELMREKRVVSSAVNIRTNKEKMKVHAPPLPRLPGSAHTGTAPVQPCPCTLPGCGRGGGRLQRWSGAGDTCASSLSSHITFHSAHSVVIQSDDGALG